MELNDKYQKKLNNIEKMIDQLPDDSEVILSAMVGFLIKMTLETQQMIEDQND